MSAHGYNSWLDRYWIPLVILFGISFVLVLNTYRP